MRFRHCVILTLMLAGCSRFVWNEDPFTPDPAPATEILAAGHDTMYVLRRASYYLLTSQRAALWNREVVEDVAWRYRSLFGEAPPLIAIRLDSATVGDSATWRGVPLASVRLGWRDDAPRAGDRRQAERAERDSVTARLLAGPLLAATAAQTWLEARAIDLNRNPDTQPGGPSRSMAWAGGLPAWIEAGALRLLASPGAADRATAEVRANPKGVIPLTTLFAVRWPAKPNVGVVVGLGRPVLRDDDAMMTGSVERARPGRDGGTVPGVAPLFISQSVSLLAFIRERDASLVARLADELPRGRSVADVLANSTGLPRDIASLEAEWAKWLKRSARRR